MESLNHENIKSGILLDTEGYRTFINTIVNANYSDIPKSYCQKRHVNPEISENDFPAAKAWKEFLVANMGLKVVYFNQTSMPKGLVSRSPHFRKDNQEVHMPITWIDYKTSAGYWDVFFHECVHWAKLLIENDPRFQEETNCSSGLYSYSFEELIAQFGSLTLKRFFGIYHQKIDARYLKNWARRIVAIDSNDPAPQLSILDCLDYANNRVYLLLEKFLEQD